MALISSKIVPEDGGNFHSNVDVNVQDFTMTQHRLADSVVVFICHAYVSVALTNELHGELSSSEAASRSSTKEFPYILRTERFITVFTRARHWSLFCAK
jgi:hypothetical protein